MRELLVQKIRRRCGVGWRSVERGQMCSYIHRPSSGLESQWLGLDYSWHEYKRTLFKISIYIVISLAAVHPLGLHPPLFSCLVSPLAGHPPYRGLYLIGRDGGVHALGWCILCVCPYVVINYRMFSYATYHFFFSLLTRLHEIIEDRERSIIIFTTLQITALLPSVLANVPSGR